jgi:hypothetical protein
MPPSKQRIIDVTVSASHPVVQCCLGTGVVHVPKREFRLLGRAQWYLYVPLSLMLKMYALCPDIVFMRSLCLTNGFKKLLDSSHGSVRQTYT